MRALIICTLLLLHGMMSLAQYGFPSSGAKNYQPKCRHPCTSYRQCPPGCRQCLKYANTEGPVCSKRNRFK
uniref:Putative 5.3 kDa protein n=1 Tax=Ixodes ricinus TaxID=34613 RepID=A0A147BFK2_IXORI